MDRKGGLIRLAYPLLAALVMAGCFSGGSPTPQGPTPEQSGEHPSETTTPPSRQPEEARDTLKRADDLLLKGKASDAAEILIPLISDFPDDASGWDLLGIAYSRMGNFKVAQLVGERAVALAPSDAATRFNTGVSSARAANLQRATFHLQKASELNHDQADPIYMLAKVYEAAQQLEQARSAFEDGLKRFPDDRDLKRAISALGSDFTMDGKGERITISKKELTITDGSTGAVLGSTDGWQTARAADLGGEAPVLIAINPSYLAVYIVGRGGLSEAGRFSSASATYKPVDQAVVVETVTDQKRKVDYYRMQNGRLEVASQFVYPTNPFSAPADLVELFAAVITNNPAAFQDSMVRQDLLDHLKAESPPQVQAPFLLARSDGTYEMELFRDGKITQSAKAEVIGNKVARIEWSQ